MVILILLLYVNRLVIPKVQSRKNITINIVTTTFNKKTVNKLKKGKIVSLLAT